MARFLALSLIGLFTICGVARKLESAAAQDESARQFVGTWRLVSFTNQLADGTLKPDPRNVGYIVYGDTGRMCAMLVDPHRPKWASATAPTPTEAVAALEAMFSYCGTYEVNARDGFVVHHVEIDKSPNNVGLHRKRRFTFEGTNRLTLRVEQPELPGITASTLVWERVEPIRGR